MSFMTKFKSADVGTTPAGVNLEHSSFGYSQNQNTYAKPQFQKEGWDEDNENDTSLQINSKNTFSNQNNTVTQAGNLNTIKSPLSAGSNNVDDLNLGPGTRKGASHQDLQIRNCDEKFIADYDYENKIINELIQPGGARLKQPDNALNNFCKASESFQTGVVGSLLLSKLYEGIPYVSKMVIVKRIKKYQEYFNYNIDILRNLDFSSEGSNANQLSKFAGEIVQYIQNQSPQKQVGLFPLKNLTYSKQVTPVVQHSAVIIQKPSVQDNNSSISSSVQKNKADPFGFIKKQTVESITVNTRSQSQTDTQSFDLLDFGLDMQPFPTQQQVPDSRNSQSNFPSGLAPSPLPSQNKKLNPFDIVNSTQTVNSSTGKSTPNVPLNFKRFQGNTPNTPAQVTISNQTSQQFVGNPSGTQNSQNALNGSENRKQNQFDDLLGSLSGLDFGGNQPQPQLLNKVDPIQIHTNQLSNGIGTQINSQQVFSSHPIQGNQSNQLNHSTHLAQNQGLTNKPLNSSAQSSFQSQSQPCPPSNIYGTNHYQMNYLPGMFNNINVPMHNLLGSQFHSPYGNLNSIQNNGPNQAFSSFNSNPTSSTNYLQVHQGLNSYPNQNYSNQPQYGSQTNTYDYNQSFNRNSFQNNPSNMYIGGGSGMTINTNPSVHQPQDLNSHNFDEIYNLVNQDSILTSNLENAQNKKGKQKNEALFDSLRF